MTSYLVPLSSPPPAVAMPPKADLKPAVESYQRFLQMSQGENPNQEWQARQRIKLLEKEISNK